jgi:ppGpp synthetase/RelA/SpoT-type nucleotidyltranferase
MSKEIEEWIEKLVMEHFPWGQKDISGQEAMHKEKPEHYQEARAYVEDWLSKDRLLEKHSFCVGNLHKVLDNLIRSEGFKKSCRHGEGRFVARMETENQLKQPESILEKMARAWKEKGGEKEPPIKFHQLFEVDDLARLRIVVNFVGDMENLRLYLEEPYRSGVSIDGLSDEQKRLMDDFDLKSSCFEDRLLVDPKDRKKGERCYKGIFCSKQNKEIKIEIQIVTMLQEAWDKKDHFLLYEPMRQGRYVEKHQKIKSYALSESLYLLDTAFDQMFNEVYPKKGSKE